LRSIEKDYEYRDLLYGYSQDKFSGYIERFNRTIQTIIDIDNLQDFANSYNNREHEMIGMT
jgi:uncharacterized protein YutD